MDDEELLRQVVARLPELAVKAEEGPISSKPQREWQEPTTAEIKALWNITKKPSEFAKLLLAKVKEKNT